MYNITELKVSVVKHHLVLHYWTREIFETLVFIGPK